MQYRGLIDRIKRDHISVIERFLEQEEEKIINAVVIAKDVILKGGKILIFGNGGSAADAQHLAGELVNRFKMERRPLPAIALTTDTSVLTAISNDYDFSQVFVKQIQALGTEGDLVMAISTSGNSPNVVEALKVAKEMNLYTIGLGGGNGGKMVPFCDTLILVPSNETPRIQEGHLVFLHLFSELLEIALFS
ncbi:MAG: D-sedoheptulose 7-phosphate isomerase [Caldimicrobium sp.]|nr:D-sedoheptulose 7-phosphate isomerase [Caldimicrobium sp.]MCX7613098.1 D-sedoheptulose 7-phosphate isomerase [Caldimicrobium sp.]MDW8183053.1 D-sedoheptulose 7-phosphate isomerase [Caldimicrobium sp.]